MSVTPPTDPISRLHLYERVLKRRPRSTYQAHVCLVRSRPVGAAIVEGLEEAMEVLILMLLLLTFPFGVLGLFLLVGGLGLWRDYGSWAERNNMHGVDGALAGFLAARAFDQLIRLIKWVWRVGLKGER